MRYTLSERTAARVKEVISRERSTAYGTAGIGGVPSIVWLTITGEADGSGWYPARPAVYHAATLSWSLYDSVRARPANSSDSLVENRRYLAMRTGNGTDDVAQYLVAGDCCYDIEPGSGCCDGEELPETVCITFSGAMAFLGSRNLTRYGTGWQVAFSWPCGVREGNAAFIAIACTAAPNTYVVQVFVRTLPDQFALVVDGTAEATCNPFALSVSGYAPTIDGCEQGFNFAWSASVVSGACSGESGVETGTGTEDCISTLCCECVPLAINVTIPSGCDCYEGSHTLDYDLLDNVWRKIYECTNELGGASTVTIQLRCSTSPAGWILKLACDAAFNEYLCDEGYICDPLLITWTDLSVSDTNCCNPVDLTIVATE